MNDDAKKYLELVHTLEDAHTAKFVAWWGLLLRP